MTWTPKPTSDTPASLRPLGCPGWWPGPEAVLCPEPGSESALHSAPVDPAGTGRWFGPQSRWRRWGLRRLRFLSEVGAQLFPWSRAPPKCSGGGRTPRIQLRLEPQPSRGSCFSVLWAGTKSGLQGGPSWHLGRGPRGVSLAHSEQLTPPAICVCVHMHAHGCMCVCVA